MHNMLLQILEDGEITMSDGQVISFRNCIIIMTSNVGVEAMDKALNPMGYTTSSTKRSLDQEDVLNLATDALKREFAPEFLNRLDGVIAFKDLDREIAKSIVMLELDKLKDRIVMNYLGCTLKISDAVVEELLNLGFSPEYGAREIRRAVERYIEDPLAQKMFGLDDTTIVISEFRADIKRGKIEINRREQGPPIPVIDTASFYDNPLPIH